MDEDDTQHLDGPMAVLLTAAVALTVVVALMALAALMAGCAVAIHVQAEPALDKPVVTGALLDGSTTQDGDSK
jgi:hypothetical protein